MPESEHRTRGQARAESAGKDQHTELKVAAAALAAAASAPLGIAVAAGAALSSPSVRDALREGTVRTVAGAIQAGNQISAAVARRASTSDAEAEDAEADAQRMGNARAG